MDVFRTFRRDDDGGLIIFSLFVFLLIVMMCGMAVDLIRHDRERVAIQNILDSAVLSSANLESGAQSEAEVEAVVKSYLSSAGYRTDLVRVYPVVGNGLTRDVAATYDFKLDTMFMKMIGVPNLEGHLVSRAQQSASIFEISLVLDVSGSMGYDGKIEALRPAAKKFVTGIFDKLGADQVRMSIVPYNHQVHLDDVTRAEINWTDKKETVPGGGSLPAGAVTQYQTLDPETRCARFYEDDFSTTRLTTTSTVAPTATFVDFQTPGYTNTAFEPYLLQTIWCNSSYAPLYLYRDSPTALNTFIDTLQGRGATSIDYGMNWAVGIMDPTFKPVIKALVDNSTLPSSASGHPYRFDDVGVTKIVVLMTDGMNTNHLDLDDPFKSGPSRIWYSDTLAGGLEFNGYLVEMPDNPASQRWFRPKSPLSDVDDEYLAETALPTDAVQWDYHQLYGRFRVEDIPDYFFSEDADAHLAHSNARIDIGSFETADTRTSAICTEAKANGVQIYTISFQSPEVSQTLLRNCATTTSHYYDVDDLDIASAFDSIVAHVAPLKLTQ